MQRFIMFSAVVYSLAAALSKVTRTQEWERNVGIDFQYNHQTF